MPWSSVIAEVMNFTREVAQIVWQCTTSELMALP